MLLTASPNLNFSTDHLSLNELEEDVFKREKSGPSGEISRKNSVAVQTNPAKNFEGHKLTQLAIFISCCVFAVCLFATCHFLFIFCMFNMSSFSFSYYSVCFSTRPLFLFLLH